MNTYERELQLIQTTSDFTKIDTYQGKEKITFIKREIKKNKYWFKEHSRHLLGLFFYDLTKAELETIYTWLHKKIKK